MSLLGQKLKQFRKTYNITQQQLADRMGTSPMVISSWERGVRNPKKESLEKLIDSFRLNPSIQETLIEYFGGDNSEDSNSTSLYESDPILLKKNLYGYDTYAIDFFSRRLNEKGQVKVLQYIEDISGGFRYQEKSPISVDTMFGDDAFSLRRDTFSSYISEKLNADGIKKVIDYSHDLCGNRLYSVAQKVFDFDD